MSREAPRVFIEESGGPNSGLFYSTDNEMMVAGRVNVFRAETTGAFDSTIWTADHIGSGSGVHTAGELVVATGVTANSRGRLTTAVKHRQMSGTTQMYINVVRLNDLGVAGNVRRWGIYDDNNGYFFELDGVASDSSFFAVSRKAGVDTRVPYSAWNGPIRSQAAWSPSNLLTMNQFNIFFGGLSCRWQINGRVAHRISVLSQTSPLTESLNLPFRYESINSGGTATNESIFVRGTSFHRISPMDVSPRHLRINSATTTVVNLNPGTLRRLVLNNPSSGGTITVYDNTSATGTPIAVVSVPGSSNNPFYLEYGMELTTGLTVVTSSAMDLTVIFD